MRRATLAFALLATSLSAQGQWRRFAPTPDFEPSLGAVAYDPISGFGYYAGRTPTPLAVGETWRHVDGTWQAVAPATPLPSFHIASQARTAAAWPGHGMMFVSSGQTWRFDGTTWSQLPVTTPAMGLTSMAFDEARQVMVGIAEIPSFGVSAVFEFNGTAWQGIANSSVPLVSCRLAWCALAQRVVLVGVGGIGRSYHSWDGTTWTWHGSLGGGNANFSLAAAPGGFVLLAWGDTNGFGPTELWNGATGGMGQPTGPGGPTFRSSSVSWFDSVHQRTVVTSFDENWTTWTWNGTAWSVSGAGELPPSSDNVAYDSWRGELLMAGGWSVPSVEHGDLWARRGTQWQRIGTGPFAPRRYANVAFDSHRGRLVMVGGATHDPLPGGGMDYFPLLDGKTWEWDGASWLDATPPGPTPANHPSRRYGSAIAFDRQRGRVVLFGGAERVSPSFSATVYNDTWEWDGATWVQVSPGGPFVGIANTPSMAFDSASGRCWLQPSQTQGLYSWNGTGWTFEEALPGWFLGALRIAEDPAQGLVALSVTHAWARQGPGTWVQLAMRTSDGRAAFDLARGAVVGIDARGTFEVGDPAAAVIEPIGNGCAGTNGVPVLHSEQPPRLGTTLPLRVERMPVNGIVVGLLGGDTGTWLGVPLPLDVAPLGLPGCALGTPIDVTVTLLSPDWSIPLPAFTPSLIGASFRAQALVLDPPANAFGAVLSNTLRLRAGA